MSSARFALRCLPLLAWCLAPPAGAATPLQECSAAAAGAEVTACLEKKVRAAERDMVEAVTELRRQMRQRADRSNRTKSAFKAFETAQSRFLAYREADCRWHYDATAAQGGAAEAVARDCMARLTAQRAGELRAALAKGMPPAP